MSHIQAELQQIAIKTIRLNSSHKSNTNFKHEILMSQQSRNFSNMDLLRQWILSLKQ